MIVFNLLFVILLLIPLAVFMFFIIRKLISEYNKSIRKTTKNKNKDYRDSNYKRNYPEYDAYRRRTERNNLRNE